MAHVWSSRTIDAVELANLYEWLDRVPLSKTRNQVEKDFADGQLAAEIVHFYFPEIVELREYQAKNNVNDRQNQWKILNGKVFRRIGLNLPSHVITQLSICKTGIAQSFLYNLRACLQLSGAYTYPKSLSVLSDPLLGIPPPLLRQPPYTDDPLWYKYNHNLLKIQKPGMYPDEFEYYWHKRHAAALLNNKNKTSKPFSETLYSPKGTVLPAINPYRFVLPAASQHLAAAKLEIDDKTQRMVQKEDEVIFLRGQLKRMEILLQNKNAKIQELMDQVERQKPYKRTTI